MRWSGTKEGVKKKEKKKNKWKQERWRGGNGNKRGGEEEMET